MDIIIKFINAIELNGGDIEIREYTNFIYIGDCFYEALYHENSLTLMSQDNDDISIDSEKDIQDFIDRHEVIYEGNSISDS